MVRALADIASVIVPPDCFSSAALTDAREIAKVSAVTIDPHATKLPRIEISRDGFSPVDISKEETGHQKIRQPVNYTPIETDKNQFRWFESYHDPRRSCLLVGYMVF